MTWFKVDDDLAFHRKVVQAGNAAMGLWVRAGAWSAQQLTDGFVPDDIIAILGTPAQRKKLIAARLWLEVDGGCLFHEWSENGRQPTAQSVRDQRAKAAKRQSEYRDRNAATFSASSQVTDPCNGVTDASVTEPLTLDITPSVMGAPTRPDPSTSNEVLSEGAADASPPKPGRSRRKPTSRLPEDWRPTENHAEYARRNGIDLRHEAEQFRNHAAANDRRQVDWNAAFRQWLGNATKWQRPHLQPVPSWRPSLTDPDAEFARLRAEADGQAASRLIGRPILLDPQPIDDDTDPRAWRRARTVEWIDAHEHEIRAHLTQDTA